MHNLYNVKYRVSTKIYNIYIVTIPLIISFFALMNSRYASKLTKEKLRLDLYNKRFDIYLKTLGRVFKVSTTI